MRLWSITVDMLRSPLARRVAAVVFCSVLVVEAVILLPSYLRRESDLLGELRHAGAHWTIAVTRHMGPAADPQQLAAAILDSDVVVGVIVVRNGRQVATVGEAPDVHLAAAARRTADGSRYDVRLLPGETGASYTVLLRLDSTHVDQQLAAFVLRVSGLVLIITAVLTLATMVAMSAVVLRPLTRLKTALDLGDLAAGGAGDRDFRRRDEIGDVYRASAGMLNQLRTSHETLEATVADRTAELKQQKALLEATLANIRQGVAVFDADHDLVTWNAQYRRLRDLPAELLTSRPNLRDIFEFQARRGMYGHITGTVEEQVEQRLAASTSGDLMTAAEEHLTDGSVQEVRSQRLPDGSLVRTFVDVTGRKRIEESQRAILDAIALPIFVISRDDTYFYVNEHAAALINRSGEHLVGEPVTTSIFADLSDRRRFLDLLERDGKVDNFEVEIRTADGSRGWAMIAARTLMFQGKPASLSLVSNITGRKFAENALRQSEARLRAIIDHVPMLMNLKDLDGHYSFLNERYARWLGMPLENVLGKTAFDVLPRERAELLTLKEKALVESGEAQVFEGLAVSPSREPGRIMQFFKFPVRGDGGAITALGTVVLDVTQRAEAEEALRRSEALQRAIFDDASIGIVQQIPDGTVRLAVNRAFCEMTGYTEEELLVPGRVTVTHPDDQDAAIEARERFARGESSEDADEFRIIRKDGKVRWVSRSLTALRDENDEIERYVSFVKDVTEAKRAEQEMAAATENADAANRAKSDLVAMVSHEVRTPMNGVLGMAQLLRGTPLDKGQRDSLETIISSAELLLRIVNDLLDMSRLEAGQVELEAIPFAPVHIVESSTAVLAARAKEKGIELITRIDPKVPPLLIGDPYRLRQVLINLVANAVKFTPSGSVTVEVKRTSRRRKVADLEFAVTDTGRGIEPETQQRLFAPFTQGAAAIARKYGGTGLGLSICRHLVALMGGTVSLVSDLGRGSTFSIMVSLPVDNEGTATSLPKPAAAAGLATAADDDAPANRSLDILQVEDNETNSQLVEHLMARAGHRVVTVTNGREALDMMDREAFDLIIMDRHMPVMDGVEATRRIRAKDGPLRSIPIVGITAGAMDEDVATCLDAGMDRVLTKPVDADELFHTVARLTQRNGAPTTDVGPPVLVVDDVKVNREVARRQLQRLGVPADILGRPEEALEKLKAGGYGLALVDIDMPGMDGVELARRLRQAEADIGRRTPLVAMTGHVSAEDKRRYKAVGIDGCLAKPVDLDELKAVVERWRGHVGTADEASPVDLDGLAHILGEDDRRELFAMLDLFVQSFPDLMTPLTDAVERNQAAPLHHAAHAARSAAASAAAGPMADLLLRLEREAKAEDWETLAMLSEQVLAEYDRIAAFCRNERKAG